MQYDAYGASEAVPLTVCNSLMHNMNSVPKGALNHGTIFERKSRESSTEQSSWMVIKVVKQTAQPQVGFTELKKMANDRANIGSTIIGAPIAGQ